MKIKLDENVHVSTQAALAGWGHDVTTVHDERLAGRPDKDIANAVRTERRCLVTFDLDFANTHAYPPSEFAGLVVLRLRVPTAKAQARRLVSFFSATPDIEGRLWIVDDARVRDGTA